MPVKIVSMLHYLLLKHCVNIVTSLVRASRKTNDNDANLHEPSLK